MKRIFFILVTITLMLVSCATTPEPKKEEPPKVEAPKPVEKEEPKVEEVPPKKEEPKPVEPAKEPEPVEKPEPKKEEPVVEKDCPEELKKDGECPENEVVAKFDGVTITKKDKEEAKSEIEIVVAELNKVTSRRDYYEWRNFLSASYIKTYSDRNVLRKVSQGLPGIAKGIQLKSLRDYFIYVFVPSRQKVRFDDISYLSPTKVRVIKKEKNKSLIFYNLEKLNGKWLLVP